jgi:hypothetical protein
MDFTLPKANAETIIPPTDFLVAPIVIAEEKLTGSAGNMSLPREVVQKNLPDGDFRSGSYARCMK